MASDTVPLFFAVGSVLLLVVAGLGSLAAAAVDNLRRHRLRHLLRGEKYRGLRRVLLEQSERWQRFVSRFWLTFITAAAVFFAIAAVAGFGREHPGAVLLAAIFPLFVLIEIVCREFGARYAHRIVATLIPVLAAGTGFFAARRNAMNTVSAERVVFEPSVFRASDLENICVEDVMTPRAAIEAIDLEVSWGDVRARLVNGYHSYVPVYRDDLGNLAGILYLQRVVAPALRGDLSLETLTGLLQTPYFVPANTDLLSQLHFFRENHQHLGLVVDEYGEILGLVTPEDIVAEISRIAATSPTKVGKGKSGWNDDGTALIDGSRTLREINREFGLDFPLDGPKTLNGLILEHFQDIPEAGISLKIGHIAVEIVQTQDKSVKIARVVRPRDG